MTMTLLTAPIREEDPAMAVTHDCNTRVERAAADVRRGKVVVLVGGDADTDGYLVVAGETATAAGLDFVIRHSSGFLCAPLSHDIVGRIVLPPMVGADRASTSTDYTVAVDAATGVGTGISAADRATTLRQLANPASTPESFTRPGHVVPIRTDATGVLTRPSYAEATVDLMRAAGLHPVAGAAALISPTDPTSIADQAESRAFAEAHGLNWVSIDDITAYRRRTELHIRRTFHTMRASPHGPIQAVGFHSDATNSDYIVYSPTAASPSQRLRVHTFFETDAAPHAPIPGRPADAPITQVLTEPHRMVVVARLGHRAGSTDADGASSSPDYPARIADMAQVLTQFGVEESQLVYPLRELPEALRAMTTSSHIR
ncbi:3,4-dihydroxy-2-butanone-4-phosphate synthase [Gordonia rubripertincta]|uniref:3,4-dihydroxy-2-butanone-4-phosphate synthase n=1 Tax=Gordonia rubripertincta TaxID=36822 RepID=A0ABT4MVT0_GORRU|nr:3,4-dihydroxy-2-butanone-4-phosphate synthase [Gordonia rubripertincta]MCZ4551072.1 3,4-dihydroxy-2-butanone-4-phosphate synthase [Gordonia rubripertincta]